jgi:hypothetical protein
MIKRLFYNKKEKCMGYQESFIGGSKTEFYKLEKQIKFLGENHFSNFGVIIPFIITVKKNGTLLGKDGNKFLYVCGERYPQSHIEEFLSDENWYEKYDINCIFSEEIIDAVYDDDLIYSGMETKYVYVENFNF